MPLYVPLTGAPLDEFLAAKSIFFRFPLTKRDRQLRFLEPLLGKTKNRQSDECAFRSGVPGTNLLAIVAGPPRKHPTIWRRRLLPTGTAAARQRAPPPLYGPGGAERLLFVPCMRPARTDIPSNPAAPGLISAPSVDGHLWRSRKKKRCLLTVNAEDAELGPGLNIWAPSSENQGERGRPEAFQHSALMRVPPLRRRALSGH
ncbi:hypothetical protein HPB50_011371 [Hyalomma asiaticum]|uniref:Uncharacterized protein n=1 Tax=Hyalomma asiaticum TaxID=266040 RepID=A0ACB7RPH2_HYAAI|nr:hypothetical protein HPB50_011371 [Hyalomma asiaticum]